MQSIRPKVIIGAVGFSLVAATCGAFGSGVLAASASTTGLSTVRINSGGPAMTDIAGFHWQADTGYVDGRTASTTANITNTRKPDLFRTNRYGMSAYHIPVTNGTYTVSLLEAET